MKEIPLTQEFIALVDDEDFEVVSRYRWFVRRSGRGMYASANLPCVNGKQPHIHMHRLILGITDPRVYVDHADHNGLNNRRYNLRACTPSQNICNSRMRSDNASGIKGVSWVKLRGKWTAHITAGGKVHYLGLFTDKRAAAEAYANAARELHGEFANLESDVSHIRHAPLFGHRRTPPCNCLACRTDRAIEAVRARLQQLEGEVSK